ncbi:MAG: hypothetical protein EOP45_22865 [Sphingobacteriaceae bacterium]|nr:MAG: hypothetical protein EOP45_22865 [Sphingobacteriaceae bacterium]
MKQIQTHQKIENMIDDISNLMFRRNLSEHFSAIEKAWNDLENYIDVLIHKKQITTSELVHFSEVIMLLAEKFKRERLRRAKVKS